MNENTSKKPSGKKNLLRFAKLMEQEHALRERMRELQNRRLNGPRFTHTERHQNGVVLNVPPADLLAEFPETSSTWCDWTRDDGSKVGYFRYGPELIGELRPGFHVWLKHETKTVTVVEAPVADQATQ